MKNKEINNKSLLLNPYYYNSFSQRTKSIIILFFLCLQFVMLFLTKTYSSIIISIVCIISSLLAEFVSARILKSYKVYILSAISKGIILSLLIPSNYPFLIVFFISFIVFLVCNYCFSGNTFSWINPVALTVVVLYILNQSYFPSFILDINDIQTKNAALVLIENGTVPFNVHDTFITEFVNRIIFKFFGIVIPDGYFSFFWDSGSIIPAFRFNLLTIITSISLFSLDIFDCFIPSIFILFYSVLVRFLLPVLIGSYPVYGDVLLCLLTSGTLFSSLFLLQWYGTVPVSPVGKFIYALLASVFAFLIMGFGTSSCGFCFLILVMNVVSAIIQYIEQLNVDYVVNKKLLLKLNSVLPNQI